MDNWIEIARAGTFVDSQGRPQTFTDADLSAIASAYDPQKRDCPLVFGHPKTDAAPAFGWAQRVKATGGKLLAQFAQVPGEVKELVAKGHYRHVSMSLMPDRVTLRHVALLGAAQPAIDGLKAVELAQGEEAITVDFSTQGGNGMPDDDLQKKIGALEERVKSLESENATLKQQAQSHKDGKEKAEAEKTAAQEKADKAAADFAAYKGAVEAERREARVSALVAAGRITPAEKPGVLQFAAALAAQGGSIDFASPDGKTETISLEEKYLRDQESRPADERGDAMFSAPPAHSAQGTQTINPAELTAKL
ncbi:phage protease [uncultured Desulfovibrio sp.]|uniref:phage protease n=1 Tax=uncultured Desulfovibrio sp. TaxID=167968 RepID=UPI0025EC6EA1|nr:phage protease [uncultured Desulfovibrio sp.]